MRTACLAQQIEGLKMIASAPTLEVESKPESETETDPAVAVEPSRNGPTARDEECENLYLTGRPALKQFLRFVRSEAVNPPGEGTLTDEWKAANDYIRDLEKEEAGMADAPPIGKLGREFEPLLIEFLRNPLVRHGFNTVPTEIAIVELDRLVVYQKHIDLTFVRQLQRRLAPAPSEEEIFRTCLPAEHRTPPVKWSQVHRDKFVIMSPSNDLRFLGTMTLRPEHIRDYPPPGNLAGVLGLALGFGSNFLSALYAEKRLILNNGSHRAYALREMGVTHVPCIVEHVSSREELDVVASSEVRRNPDLYLKHARPSMLKDYFHPKLRKVMPVHRRLLQLTVKFEVEEANVPAL
jgi:hypothetical protein